MDRAVRTFGQAVEEELTAATDQGKRKKPLSDAEKNRKTRDVLQRYLGVTIEQKFRDPMAGKGQGHA